MALLTAKSLAIILALATTAFCVSTIVLAVQKNELENDLQDALDKLDFIATPTSTSTPVPVPTPDPNNPTKEPPNSPSPTLPTTSTTVGFQWPTITAPVDEPNYPTLPPGLIDPETILYRLPIDLRPIKYRLHWHPNLVTKTCEGTVSVQVEVDKETNLIVMHAKDLDIDGISILNMMARMRIRIKKYYLSVERELLIIELEELLRMRTPYTVSISFHCRLDGLSGVYASSYLTHDDEERCSLQFISRSQQSKMLTIRRPTVIMH